MAVYSSRFASYEFRDIWVLLLGHDARPVQKRSGKAMKLNAGMTTRPSLHTSGHVRQRQGRNRTKFNSEIPIANGVQGVFADALKTKQFGDQGAIRLYGLPEALLLQAGVD